MLKIVFVSGILLGFAAVLSAAGFYPWVDHPRLASRTRVLPNGGRQETFVVRLPVDRVASAGAGALAVGAANFPNDLALPPAFEDAALQLDHFKVRDASGDIVGLGSRHLLELAEGRSIVWSITLPARGTLRLIGQPLQDTVSPALARAGYQAGRAWSGAVDVSLAAVDARSGTIAGGSQEFAPLTGSYVERWQITGVDELGHVQGTIELDTTSFIAQ